MVLYSQIEKNIKSTDKKIFLLFMFNLTQSCSERVGFRPKLNVSSFFFWLWYKYDIALSDAIFFGFWDTKVCSIEGKEHL